MKIAKAIALIGLLVMSAALIFGFTTGDFSVEGSRLLAMPWGVVSIVDLYVCFALFSCWVVFREQAWLPSAIWIILFMGLGSWAVALYAFLALQRSGGDWKHFWMGRRA